MKGQFLLFVYVPYNKTKQFLIYRKFQLVDLEGSRLVPPPQDNIRFVKGGGLRWSNSINTYCRP